MENYFELYALPESFSPDKALVKKKFYELSRQYHPDRFTLAEDAEKAAVLRMSALNNEAYKTLNSGDAVMKYILQLNGVLEEEEKYNLPPAFLMEMMDLNEAVSDYEAEPGNEKLKSTAQNSLQEQLEDWEAAVNPLLANYTDATDKAALLLRIKDFYFRRKYLLRIKERLNSFAAP